jgi:hypothetical protein
MRGVFNEPLCNRLEESRGCPIYKFSLCPDCLIQADDNNMSMKVFDLSCEHDHRFEGWFASSDAFADQQSRNLIACPLCGSHSIKRLPAAARLNLSGAQQSPAPPSRSSEGAAPAKGERPGPATLSPEQFQAMFVKMTRRIIESTEDVGTRFAEEARRIHYNEAPERAIRGSTSREEVMALREEGIEVFALPLPDAPKGPLQ